MNLSKLIIINTSEGTFQRIQKFRMKWEWGPGFRYIWNQCPKYPQ